MGGEAETKPDAAAVDPDKAKFEIPGWSVKPPDGYHLDVLKGEQLIQKLMIDEKKQYYFGRNPKQVDCVVEHASCSRVHAVLLYHDILKRFALVDMGSSHGTFIGRVKLEPLKVFFVDIGTPFNFGASTRRYMLRQKLAAKEEEEDEENKEKQPNEHELENLTEYNTALNRRIPQLPISAEEARRKKRPRGNVAFIDEEDVINPEDVDPSVGRFRNLVTTAIISNTASPAQKRPASGPDGGHARKIVRPGRDHARYVTPMASSLQGMVMNSAPDLARIDPAPSGSAHLYPVEDETEECPKKKKYVKESWPGRKPGIL